MWNQQVEDNSDWKQRRTGLVGWLPVLLPRATCLYHPPTIVLLKARVLP